jgi:nitrogen fixation NifU-like protein
MNDIQDLYRDLIVEHYRNPRNFREIANANRKASGHNALCGDKFSVFLYMDDGRIADIRFVGSGCAIATASASIMTESLKGKTENEARALFRSFLNLLSGDPDPGETAALGDLSVFSGVRGYPARIKCAAFAWHIFLAALDGKEQPVETD